MPTKRCCCTCLLTSDDFNRADGPVGGDWHGSGTIVSNVLHANGDHTTVCHPASAPLGSLWGQVTLKDCQAGVDYFIRLGDPTGSYEIHAAFSGSVGVGTGIFTLTLKNGIDADVSYDYDWEYADETIRFCYQPGTQMSVAPSSRTSTSPSWLTTCIPDTPADNCWDLSGTAVGNVELVDGYFDDFSMELHWIDRHTCNDCDCYCYEDDVQTCIPEVIYATLSGSCVSGTYTMRQKFITTTSPLDPPSSIDWPQKFEWVSDPITCKSATQEEYGFVLILRCSKDPAYSYPRMLLKFLRYGSVASASCSEMGFDLTDPDTEDIDRDSADMESFARSKSTSTCSPLYLEYPQLVEGGWACNDTIHTCCGGYVNSGGPILPDEYIGVTITE